MPLTYDDAQSAAEHYAELASQLLEAAKRDDRPVWLPEQTIGSVQAYCAVSRAYAACAANAQREMSQPIDAELEREMRRP